MYNLAIKVLSNNKTKLYKEYVSLCVPEIVTMLVLSFVKVFDKVIANLIGVEVLAGISMASGYAEVMLLFGVAVRMVASVEYAKTKDLKLLGTMYKLQFILQVISVILTIIVGNILTINSGLSFKAKHIASVSLLIYGIYYILLDYTRFIKIILITDKRSATVSKIVLFTTIFNVGFDIVVFILKLNWVWLVLDNVITELLSIILVLISLKGKNLVFGKVTELKCYYKSMVSAIIDSGAKRFLYLVMPFVLSFLGDAKYAKYVILVTVIDQLIYPTWNNTAFTSILLNDGYSQINIKTVICSFAVRYSTFCAVLAVPLYLLFGKVEVNYLLLMILAFMMVLTNTVQCFYTGLNRYNNLYSSCAKVQMICTIACVVWLSATVFLTGNEYLAYMMWIVRNFISILLYKRIYNRFIKNN